MQFEWAWQHPIESLAVRNAAVTFKSLSGLANKIKLAYTMVTLPAWQRYGNIISAMEVKGDVLISLMLIPFSSLFPYDQLEFNSELLLHKVPEAHSWLPKFNRAYEGPSLFDG